MADRVQDADTAETIAENYAAQECVGTFGGVIDVTRDDSTWIVEFRTHTFSEEYVHRVEITETVGNIITHDQHAAPA